MSEVLLSVARQVAKSLAAVVAIDFIVRILRRFGRI